jgi:hypothetical protein
MQPVQTSPRALSMIFCHVTTDKVSFARARAEVQLQAKRSLEASRYVAMERGFQPGPDWHQRPRDISTYRNRDPDLEDQV